MAKAGAAKIPGAGMVKEAAGKVPKPDPKMMGMAKESLKHAGAAAKGAGKAAGISFGVASILKQSQLFTGVIGTIFQILGMLVDVIIMPFMPILIPVIKLFASMIPPLMAGAMFIQRYIQIGVDWLGTAATVVWDTLKGWWTWIAGKVFSGPLHPVKGFFETIKNVISAAMDIGKAAWDIAKAIIQGVWDLIKVIFSPEPALDTIISPSYKFLIPPSVGAAAAASASCSFCANADDTPNTKNVSCSDICIIASHETPNFNKWVTIVQ